MIPARSSDRIIPYMKGPGSTSVLVSSPRRLPRANGGQLTDGAGDVARRISGSLRTDCVASQWRSLKHARPWAPTISGHSIGAREVERRPKSRSGDKETALTAGGVRRVLVAGRGMRVSECASIFGYRRREKAVSRPSSRKGVRSVQIGRAHV